MLILIISLIALILCIVIFSIYLVKKVQLKDKTKISFKEGLDLTELPIVTFMCGDKKLHFLLDTGSNISYINKEVLETIPYQNTGVVSNTIGVEGKGLETNHCSIEIGYKDNKFIETFGAIDLSASFESIEEESGVKIHGILGSKFFEKYKYILDFKELAAYR